MEIMEEVTPPLNDKSPVSLSEGIDLTNIEIKSFTNRSKQFRPLEDIHLDMESAYANQTNSKGGSTSSLRKEPPHYLFPCCETMDQQVNSNILSTVHLNKTNQNLTNMVRPIPSVRPKQNLNSLHNQFRSFLSPQIPLAIKNKSLSSRFNVNRVPHKSNNSSSTQNRVPKSFIVCQYCAKKHHSENNCWLLEARLREPNAQWCVNCKRKHPSHLCRAHPMEGVNIPLKDRIVHKNCTYCEQTYYKYKRPFILKPNFAKSVQSFPPSASVPRYNRCPPPFSSSQQTRHGVSGSQPYNYSNYPPLPKSNVQNNSKVAHSQKSSGEKSVVICKNCLWPNYIAATGLALPWRYPHLNRIYNKNQNFNFEKRDQAKKSNVVNNKKSFKYQNKYVNDQLKNAHHKKEPVKVQNEISPIVKPILKAPNPQIGPKINSSCIAQTKVQSVLSDQSTNSVPKIIPPKASQNTVSISSDKSKSKNSVSNIKNNISGESTQNVCKKADTIKNVSGLVDLCSKVIQSHKLILPTVDLNKLKNVSIENLTNIENRPIPKIIVTAPIVDTVPELSSCSISDNSVNNIINLNKSIDPILECHKIEKSINESNNIVKINTVPQNVEKVNLFESPKNVNVDVKSNVSLIGPSDKNSNDILAKNIVVNKSQLTELKPDLIKSKKIINETEVIVEACQYGENEKDTIGLVLTQSLASSELQQKEIDEFNEMCKEVEEMLSSCPSSENNSMENLDSKNNSNKISPDKNKLKNYRGKTLVDVSNSPIMIQGTTKLRGPNGLITRMNLVNENGKNNIQLTVDYPDDLTMEERLKLEQEQIDIWTEHSKDIERMRGISSNEIKNETVPLAENKIDLNSNNLSEPLNESLVECQNENKGPLQSDKSGNVEKMQNNSLDVTNEEIGSTTSELIGTVQINNQVNSNKKTKKKNKRSGTLIESLDQVSHSETKIKNKHHFDMAGTLKFMKIRYDSEWNWKSIGERFPMTHTPNHFRDMGIGNMVPSLETLDNILKFKRPAHSCLTTALACEIERNPIKYGFVLREKYKSYWENVKNGRVCPPLCFLHAYSNLRQIDLYLFHNAPKPLIFEGCGHPSRGPLYMVAMAHTCYRVLIPEKPSEGVPLGIPYKIYNVKIEGFELIVKEPKDLLS